MKLKNKSINIINGATFVTQADYLILYSKNKIELRKIYVNIFIYK